MLCAVDLLHVFLELFTGLFGAVLRVLMALGVMFVAILRVDRSLFPKWIDEIIVLDAMAKAFRSLVVMYHHHNNPSVHVFLMLLAEAAAQRKADANSPRKNAIAANRWRKYAFMVLNPKVAVYKAKYTPPEPKQGFELKVIKAKKGQVVDGGADYKSVASGAPSTTSTH